MVRNKYKGIDNITSVPTIVDNMIIGQFQVDCAYREARFHMSLGSDMYKRFMEAFNKIGMSGFALTIRPKEVINEEIR